jgi:hypothetical protein
MLPHTEGEHATAAAEASIADRIQEILLQQQVDKLLDDWLASLRAQGSVQILKPGRGGAMSGTTTAERPRDDNRPAPRIESGGEKRLGLRPVKKRSIAGHIRGATAWLIAGVVALVIVVVGGFWWYSTTADFQGRVGKEIVSVLENATGGRVELRGVKLQPVGSGDRGRWAGDSWAGRAGRSAVSSADKIQVRVKITNFFAHATGPGWRRMWG